MINKVIKSGREMFLYGLNNSGGCKRTHPFAARKIIEDSYLYTFVCKSASKIIVLNTMLKQNLECT
ncbi:MAG: hypothetical protein BWY26_00421 [Elusimicrobia bacterium ADurb.Bin231]|nr:MAG: hypothetical protein BWY26_00421 [Elusimicrobia bacterium ADurb.Bin231]